MVSKYDTDFDMTTENSHSLIIKMITPNSRVLEFGCAYGKMTKYLTEELNCDLAIVKMNEKAGLHASQYATTSCYGPENGDI